MLAYVGYLKIFTHFSPWDDEGFFILSAKLFHQSVDVYSGANVVYGPFYYEVIDLLATVFRLPFTHDTARFVSLATVLAISLVCGLVIARVTGARLLGYWTQLLVFRTFLPGMALEPTHPEGLLCLLMCGIVATAIILESRPRFGLALQGALVCSISLTKVNAGAFAFLALLVGWSLSFETRSFRRVIVAFTSCLFILAPSMLMSQKLGDDSVRRYAFVVTAAAAAVALACVFAESGSRFKASDAKFIVAGAAAMFLLVVSRVLIAGSSVRVLVNAILLRPLRYRGRVGIPVQLGPHHRTIAIFAVIACILLILYERRAKNRSPYFDATLALIRLGVGLTLAYSVLMVFLTYLPIGFTFVPLACLAVLKPSGIPDPPELRWTRLILAPLAVTQTLQAFPVAGSQVTIGGSFLLVPLGVICVRDAALQMTVAFPSARRPVLAHAGALALIVIGFVSIGRSVGLGVRTPPGRTAERSSAIIVPQGGEWQHYIDDAPLPLRGSTRIHLPAEQLATLTWVSRTLEDRCTAFVTLPALNSFYLWTGQEPPMGITLETWWYDVPLEEQRRLVDRLRRVDRLCVLRHPELLEFWRSVLNTPPSSPLLDYVGSEFVPAASRGRYEIYERRSPALTR